MNEERRCGKNLPAEEKKKKKKKKEKMKEKSHFLSFSYSLIVRTYEHVLVLPFERFHLIKQLFAVSLLID